MIDTKLLRQKILDLAIRGKLVPQDPTDEPASELLKKIKAEKDALVKAGKIKKDKHESHIFKGDDNRYYEQIDGRIADITDEIPFDLPDGWVWCRLGILCQKIGAGKTPLGGKSQYVSSGIPLIREQNVHNNGLSYDGMAFITQETNQSMKGSQVFAKDLLMNITGGSIGRTALIIDDFAGGNVNQHVLIIRLINSSFRHFVHRVLHSDFILGLMFSKQTGDKPGLSAEKVNRFLIPIPPLAEQQRIVEQIETLLNYVDIIDTDAETLEKSITLAKQKILDLAIRGKLVPQDPADEPASELLKKIKAKKDTLVKAGKIKKDKHESYIFKSDDNCYHENIDGKVTDITDEIPFDLPEGWHWFRLKNLCSLITDGTHQTPEYSETGYVFLSSTNVTSGKIDWKNVKYIPEKLHTVLHDRLAPQFGDILLAKNGTIGCAAIVDRVDVFDIYVSLALLRPFRTAIMSEYLHKIIGASAVQNYFAGEKKGIGLYNLHLENIRQTPIPLPPLAEQKRIVSQVEKLFSVLETMRG